MTKMVEKSFESIKSGFDYFMVRLLKMSSTRAQLVWFTCFCWASANFYFGVILSWVREISIIYYRQSSINATPINLDSPYASVILTMLGTAFMATVGAYVGSNWSTYKGQNVNTTVPGPEKKISTFLNDSDKEKKKDRLENMRSTDSLDEP